MVGDRHRCGCGLEQELASELGAKLCCWREKRPLMVAEVQLGVSERAVPPNAVLHACPLAQMVSRSTDPSLGPKAKLVVRLA